MKVCGRCLLNDNIPSVRINENGLCNYCAAPVKAKLSSDTNEEFSALLNKFKNKRYQVIMAYSGGKDSTYTLKLIREKYYASVLAVTFNNGFLSSESVKNINTVTDRLGVDNIIVKYPADKLIRAFRFAEENRLFPVASLERASSICNLCIMLVKNMIYYEAIIRGIPIICFGWTPGQVETAKPLLKLDYRMVSKLFENVKNTISGELGSEYARYFLSPEFVEQNEDSIPYLYYPFVKNAYDEEKILETIREIGWNPPENTDGNSSNCLLNSYANQCHLNRYGFHPYAFEISSMVRNGFMTREEGALKLENVKNDSSFELISKMFETAHSKQA